MLENIWYLILLFFLIGYSVLDGIDLGIGILMPFMVRADRERQVLLNSIRPFWDGYEVWLIIAGGALFATSPLTYGILLSGFYLPFFGVLLAFIIRAVSIEFWAPDSPRKKWWQVLLPLSSLTIIVLFGLMLGCLLTGLGLDAHLNYRGGFTGLLHIFPISLMVMAIAAVCMQGLLYAGLHTSGRLEQHIERLSTWIWMFYVMAFLLFFGALLYRLPDTLGRAVFWVGFGLVLLCLIGLHIATREKHQGVAMFCSSLAIVGLWLIIGSAQYPYFVKAANDPARSITIHNGMNTPQTLRNMLIFVGPAMLAVIGFSIWIHRVVKVNARGGKKKFSAV